MTAVVHEKCQQWSLKKNFYIIFKIKRHTQFIVIVVREETREVLFSFPAGFWVQIDNINEEKNRAVSRIVFRAEEKNQSTKPTSLVH